MELTLYTIQTIPAFNIFQETGILKANSDYIDPDYIDAYSWLERQMSKICNPPVGTNHLIWSWYRSNEKKNRPDLRHSGYLPRGTEGVLIEFKVDSSEVLLTDFDNWHVILIHPEEDYKREMCVLDADGIDSDDIDFPWYIKNNEICMHWKDIILQPDSKFPYIQATVWEVKMDQVVSVKKFKSR